MDENPFRTNNNSTTNHHHIPAIQNITNTPSSSLPSSTSSNPHQPSDNHLSQSQSLFTILHPQPRTSNHLNSFQSYSNQQETQLPSEIIPNLVGNIQLRNQTTPSNTNTLHQQHLNQSSQTIDDENENLTESSSHSPSPSLTTHHHPSAPDQIKLSKTSFNPQQQQQQQQQQHQQQQQQQPKQQQQQQQPKQQQHHHHHQHQYQQQQQQYQQQQTQQQQHQHQQGHQYSRLKKSILHDHRPSSSSSRTLGDPQNQQRPTDPFNLISKFKSMYSQDQASYRSNFSAQTINQQHNLNSFSHHNLNHEQNQTHQHAQPGSPAIRIDRQLNSKEMALWRWVNVDDLDSFLQEVYGYYVGNGIWAIGLSRLCNLMTVGFVIGFSIFLLGCIDYSVLRSSHHLHEVVVSKCVSRFSGLTLLLVLGFSGYYSWRVLRFGQEISKLWKMHEFFTQLLEVPEADIQTIPWYKLVDQLAKLKHQHPATIAVADGSRTRTIDTQSVLQRKLDAHDVATQIMREQNYLIALFNRDILDLTPPLPRWMIGNALVAERHLSTSLEWNLVYCLRGFILDHHGQVKPEFLVSRLDPSLATELQRRFRLMAIINFMFGPFIVIYVLIYSFFRYFEEYHKNPSSIGSRSFTRLAQWKFREYNELPHLFQERLTKSYLISKQYIDQFPKIKTTILAKFVSFIAGSFAGVLIVLSLYDPDAFLHFEITKERSVIFYIGLFGSILAISRGMIQREYEEKIERPGELMEKIVRLTHYLPNHWYGKLHGLEVFNEFGQMFQLKLIIFLHEIMSILLTPYIFWNNFDLDRCQRIIEFFREFTIHVDGIGYVCSFSVFDFNKLETGQLTDGPNLNHAPNPMEAGAQIRMNENQPMANDNNNRNSRQQHDINKLERSILNFVSHHPNWEPSTQTGSLYLSKAIGGYLEPDSIFQPTPSTSTSIHHHHHQQSNLSFGASPVRQRLNYLHNQFNHPIRNNFLSSSNPRQSFGVQNSISAGELGANNGLGIGSSRPLSSATHHQTRSSQPGFNMNSAYRPPSIFMGSSNTTGAITRVGEKGNNTSSFNNSNNLTKPIGTDFHHYRGNKSSSLMGVEAIDEEDDNKITNSQSNIDKSNKTSFNNKRVSSNLQPSSSSSITCESGSGDLKNHLPQGHRQLNKNHSSPTHPNLASSDLLPVEHNDHEDDDVDPFKT